MIRRVGIDDDIPFIVETFCKSFRAASTQAEGLSKERTARLITNLLDLKWHATIADSEGMIVGWIVHREKNELAWFYVRDLFRGQGVGRCLLKWANVDRMKRVMSPFMPNRAPRMFAINHRPYETVL